MSRSESSDRLLRLLEGGPFSIGGLARVLKEDAAGRSLVGEQAAPEMLPPAQLGFTVG
jgi:hypothetical protein